MTERGWIELEDRGVLVLEGPEARSFLQGLVSNDVERLAPDRALYAALLTPQGKYLFDFILMQQGETILLDGEAARLDELRKRLLMYRLRAKVEISDRSADLAVVALPDPALGARFRLRAEAGAAAGWQDGVVAVDPRLGALGLRAILPRVGLAELMAGLDLPALAPASFERHRLALGIPASSSDLLVQKSTLLESNFDELNGVAFDKGCYVGQELTARTKYRALVRKRLLPVRLDGPLPPPGTLVMAGEREAGELRSGSGDRAMALLRLEHVGADAAPMAADGTGVTVEWPSWLAPPG